MHAKTLHGCAAALLAGALLSACGGGGGDEAPSPAVPDTALASPDGFTQFARSLPASDSAEPLDLQRLDMAPTSETDDPVPLD